MIRYKLLTIKIEDDLHWRFKQHCLVNLRIPMKEAMVIAMELILKKKRISKKAK